MNLQIRKSSREQVKMKMSLCGPSGSGKTYSSLLLALGLCSDWTKICLIDTENGSADLYAHLGDFNVVRMSAPFSPEKYIACLELCEKEGLEVVIIDSISHCWEFLIEAHSNMVGNSFANWSKITPRHNAFVQKILQSSFHVVTTMRTKTDYVLNQKDNKMVPEKVGLRTIQRDGVDYEFTLVFDLDIKHHATASKDRTNMFIDKPEFTVSEETGKKILEWTRQGDPKGLIERINDCKSISELLELYRLDPAKSKRFERDFTKRRSQLTSTEHLITQNNGKE